jgi:hypothetical protein
VTGGTGFPAATYSLLELGPAGVLAWAVKPAEETSEGGLVVRLWNQSAGPADFVLEFGGGPILEARRTSLIETPSDAADFEDGRLTGTIAGRGWQAYHITLSGAAAPDKGIGRKKIR